MLLSSTIGRWADKHPSRLRTLQLTIFLQRTCICFACVGWTFLVLEPSDHSGMAQHDQRLDIGGDFVGGNRWKKTAIMTGLVVLGMAERLSAVGNTLVMERDWVHAFSLATPNRVY